MADDLKTPVVFDDDKPKRAKRNELPPHLTGTDKRDFVEYADALAVANAIGGYVEHIGVAYHVATDDA